MNPDNLTDEQKLAIAKENNKLVEEVVFTKGELIMIFNILVRIDMRYGDALQIVPLVKKIEPYVAVASNITQKAEEAEKVVLGKGIKN